jgi:hypothetical protein
LEHMVARLQKEEETYKYYLVQPYFILLPSFRVQKPYLKGL